jgi:hypothetical protein
MFYVSFIVLERVLFTYSFIFIYLCNNIIFYKYMARYNVCWIVKYILTME